MSILFGIRLSFTTIKRNKSTVKTWSVVILKIKPNLIIQNSKSLMKGMVWKKNKQTMKLNWIVFKHKRLAARDLIQIVSPPAVWHIKQKAALALFIFLTSDPKNMQGPFDISFNPLIELSHMAVPSERPTLIYLKTSQVGRSGVDRASSSDARGLGFEPRPLSFKKCHFFTPKP